MKIEFLDMENRMNCRMIYFGIILYVLNMFPSCLNYIPCRGQDYIIENITHQELINKFNELREKYPEYTASEDYMNKYVPHYYIRLYWKDLDLRISLDIFISDQIPNPPTYLTFTSAGNYDINSNELDKMRNDLYKMKFETEILYKLGVKWKRKKCW